MDKYTVGQPTYKSDQQSGNQDSAKDSSEERWKVDLNDSKFVDHAKRCTYHGKIYKDTFFDTKNKK